MPLCRQPGTPRAIGVALLLLSLGACDTLTGLDDQTREERELARARRNWSLSYVDDYDYVLRRRCFCQLGGEAVRVSVRRGAVVDLELESSGQPLSLTWAHAYPPVTGLFTLLQEAIDRDAYVVDAIYDGQYGIPIDIWVDYSPDVADEETGYEVASFRPYR
jgi:hypothetical protein